MSDTPFWVVWREDGAGPIVKHSRVDLAEVEAERLARTNPGHSFCVLAAVSRFTERRVTVERFNVEQEVPF